MLPPARRHNTIQSVTAGRLRTEWRAWLTAGGDAHAEADRLLAQAERLPAGDPLGWRLRTEAGGYLDRAWRAEVRAARAARDLRALEERDA